MKSKKFLLNFSSTSYYFLLFILRLYLKFHDWYPNLQASLSLSGTPARYSSLATRDLQWVYSFTDIFILKVYFHWISRVARDEYHTGVQEP